MKKKEIIGKRFSANINRQGVVEGKIFSDPDGNGVIFATKEQGGWRLSVKAGYDKIIKEGYTYGWYNCFDVDEELTYYCITDLKILGEEYTGKFFSANINGNGVVKGKIFLENEGEKRYLFATKEMGGWSFDFEHFPSVKQAIEEGYSFGWWGNYDKPIDYLKDFKIIEDITVITPDIVGKYFSAIILGEHLTGKIFPNEHGGHNGVLLATSDANSKLWHLSKVNHYHKTALAEGFLTAWYLPFNTKMDSFDVSNFKIVDKPKQTKGVMKKTKIHYKNLPSGEVEITGFENVASLEDIERVFGKAVRDKYDYELSGNISYYRLGTWRSRKHIFITPVFGLSVGDVKKKSTLEHYVDLMRKAGETLAKIRKEVWAEEKRKKDEGSDKIHTVEI